MLGTKLWVSNVLVTMNGWLLWPGSGSWLSYLVAVSVGQGFFSSHLVPLGPE
jgi:hypothetical protein